MSDLEATTEKFIGKEELEAFFQPRKWYRFDGGLHDQDDTVWPVFADPEFDYERRTAEIGLGEIFLFLGPVVKANGRGWVWLVGYKDIFGWIGITSNQLTQHTLGVTLVPGQEGEEP